MTIDSATQPSHGTVTIAGDGSGLTYTPNPNYCNDGNPTDDFTYTLNGGSTATVAVTRHLRRRPAGGGQRHETVAEDSAPPRSTCSETTPTSTAARRRSPR